MQMGQGSPYTPYDRGHTAGSSTIKLGPYNVPAHTHTAEIAIPVSENDGESDTAGGLLSIVGDETLIYGGAADSSLYSGSPIPGIIDEVGEGAPIDNMQPSLVVNYIIAIEGIYPERS